MQAGQGQQKGLGVRDWAACSCRPCRLQVIAAPCQRSQLLQQQRPASLGNRLASTHVPHARLPHMDEELEHMQWQLDKRTHDDTAGSSGHSSRRKPHKRLVFHDRHPKHGRHQQQHQPRHHHSSSSSSTVRSVEDGASSSDESAAAAAEAAAAGSSSAAVLEQQQHGLAADELFYCLQLGSAGAMPDLAKAQERLARHIHQDGGCCVAAGVAHASMLTHLLLLLQHKQLHRKSELWGSDTLLLLQPLNCDAMPAAPSAAAAAAAGQGRVQAGHSASGQHRSTVVQSGAGTQHINCACPVDELRFFVTLMPFTALLAAEHAHAASQKPGATQQMSRGGASSLQSWSASAVESSTDDAAPGRAITRSNGGSRHGSRVSSSNSSSSAELLRAAGSGSSSRGAASVLHDAATRGCLCSVHIGPHADAAATAAHVTAAVAAGEVLGLHCKGNAAAHAVAYSALELASQALSSSPQPQALGFGVLVVQGLSHEHVHARTHGHSNTSSSSSSTSSLDLQHATPGAAGAAAATAEGVQQQPHGRALLDASMDVGGFGAAFYGLGGWGDREQAQQGVLHKHIQEVWLCVVPLNMAA